jgi:hypothetical protein
MSNDDICCVCLNDKTSQPLRCCTHMLCDYCYIKLTQCPLCRKDYGHHKKSDAMLTSSSRLLDDILMVCCDDPNLDKLIDHFAVFNRLFSRWIYTTEDQDTEFSLSDERIVWECNSVDRQHVADIHNYREISDHPHKRQFMLSKALHVFDALVDQLKTYNGPDIIPKELHHLL